MKIKTSSKLVTVCAACIMLFSCHLDRDINGDFLIKVDSIHAPDTVESNTAFYIVFFGTIGFDECTSFKSFNQTKNKNDIEIETWGTYDSTPAVCAPALITLDGQLLSMSLPIPGVYRILIKDPGPITLVKKIVAK